MGPAADFLYADIIRRASEVGFLCRGGFHPETGDGVPGALADEQGTLVLLGNAGPALWRAFGAAGGNVDIEPNPLDRWTRRTVTPLAAALGAVALFPFDGPPYLPFQRWAAKAEGLSASPLGILIHPDFGLWHAYRAALLFARKIDLPRREIRESPCVRCAKKPCLKGCPVEAFAKGFYDVPACVRYLEDPLGAACVNFGCFARHACPVGRDFAPDPAQARFHMQAFLHANGAKT